MYIIVTKNIQFKIKKKYSRDKNKITVHPKMEKNLNTNF